MDFSPETAPAGYRYVDGLVVCRSVVDFSTSDVLPVGLDLVALAATEQYPQDTIDGVYYYTVERLSDEIAVSGRNSEPLTFIAFGPLYPRYQLNVDGGMSKEEWIEAIRARELTDVQTSNPSYLYIPDDEPSSP